MRRGLFYIEFYFIALYLLTAYLEVTTLYPSLNSTRMEFSLPRATILQSCPFRSGNRDLQNYTCVNNSLSTELLALNIPDRARSAVIRSLAEDKMIYACLVNIHIDVIPTWEA